MSQLSIPKNYAALTTPTEEQLDAIKNAVETFFNITKAGQDNISDAAVTTSKILDSSVVSAHFANGGVDAAAISDNSVITTTLADQGVSGSDFSTNSVTVLKLYDRVSTTSTPTSLDASALGSISSTALPNGSITVSRGTRPALISLIPSGTSASKIGIYNTIPDSGNDREFRISVKKDGSTVIGSVGISFNQDLGGQQEEMETNVVFFDPAPTSAGNILYEFFYEVVGTGPLDAYSYAIRNCKVTVREL